MPSVNGASPVFWIRIRLVVATGTCSRSTAPNSSTLDVGVSVTMPPPDAQLTSAVAKLASTVSLANVTIATCVPIELAGGEHRIGTSAAEVVIVSASAHVEVPAQPSPANENQPASLPANVAPVTARVVVPLLLTLR